MRQNNSYNTLEEIIEVLSKNPNSESIWVGKNYSKADLIKDLKELNKTYMNGNIVRIGDERAME